MIPPKYTIRAVTGDIYEVTIDYIDEAGDPIDLTGETVTAKFYSADELLFTLTDSSGLTVTPATGRIVLSLTSDQTTTLDGLPSRRFILRLDTSEQTMLVGPVTVENV